MSQVKRTDIAKEARTWVGAPYRHLGRSRQGIDCVGLVLRAVEPFGIVDYPDDIVYTRESKGLDLLRPFQERMDRINMRDVEAGDVILFKEGPFPHHCGIAIEDSGRIYIVHAEAKARKVAITTLEQMYPTAIAAFRFRGTV